MGGPDDLETDVNQRSLGVLQAAGAAVLFGSSYVATAFQLHGFTPLGAALWRSGLAALALAVIAALSAARSTKPVSGPPPPRFAARLARLAALGTLGGLIFVIGMNLAVSLVGATVTSFVAGLYAILAALFAPAVLSERLERRAAAGFILALAGTLLLAELGPSPDVLRGLAAGGMAAVSYGFYLVLIRRWSAAIQVGPVGISLATASASTIGLGIGLGLLDPRAALPFNGHSDVVVATIWLVFVTAFGPLLATAALRRIEAGLASSMLLLNPVTATLLSIALLRQTPSPPQVLGGILVLVGMAAATDLPGAIRRQRMRWATDRATS